MTVYIRRGRNKPQLILSTVVTDNAGATHYSTPFGQITGTLGEGGLLFGAAGTFRNMRVLTEAPGMGTHWDFTLRVNGVSTTLTCEVADLATVGIDVAHAVHINAGDRVNWMAVPTGATASSYPYFSVEFYPV